MVQLALVVYGSLLMLNLLNYSSSGEDNLVENALLIADRLNASKKSEKDDDSDEQDCNIGEPSIFRAGDKRKKTQTKRAIELL